MDIVSTKSLLKILDYYKLLDYKCTHVESAKAFCNRDYVFLRITLIKFVLKISFHKLIEIDPNC